MDEQRDPNAFTQPIPSGPGDAGSGARTSPRGGVSGGLAAILVLLALLIGLFIGLGVGSTAGFVVGRQTAEQSSQRPLLPAGSLRDLLRGELGRGLSTAQPPGGTGGQAPAVPTPGGAYTAPGFGRGGLGQAPANATPGPAATPSGLAARRPFIGVLVQTSGETDTGTPSTTEGAAPPGALVMSVEPGSPAESAGIQADDVIVSVDGRPIQDKDALSAAVLDAGVGQTITLGIWRAGQQLEVDVTVGDREAMPASATRGLPDLRVLPFDPSDPGLQQFLQALPPEIRQQLEDALGSGGWPPTPEANPGNGDA